MANILFTPVKINNMIVANRFVRSATHEGVLDGGGLWNSRLEEILTELADGELGLIISGHAFVSPAGRAGRNQASAASDECIAPWERIVEKLHLLQSRIILQLAHAGGFALDPETAVGPSPFAASPRRPPCRALSIAEIDQLTGQFVDAAIRAREAGFDGVQIHAAHGYLLSQFLSGHYNHRSDAYGGSPENRARLLCEIVSEIRKAVGSSFPVLVKVNSEDFVADGFQAAECVELCRKLEALGVDAIELSGGIPAAPPERGQDPGDSGRRIPGVLHLHGDRNKRNLRHDRALASADSGAGAGAALAHRGDGARRLRPLQRLLPADRRRALLRLSPPEVNLPATSGRRGRNPSAR